MEILYPMVISAVAVLATLIYASYLDLKDRRTLSPCISVHKKNGILDLWKYSIQWLFQRWQYLPP